MVTASCTSIITFTCKNLPFWLCSRTRLEPRGVNRVCRGSWGKHLHCVRAGGPGDATKPPRARGTGARNNTGSPMATGQGDKFGEWCNMAGTRPACRSKMELFLPGQPPALAPTFPLCLDVSPVLPAAALGPVCCWQGPWRQIPCKLHAQCPHHALAFPYVFSAPVLAPRHAPAHPRPLLGALELKGG